MKTYTVEEVKLTQYVVAVEGVLRLAFNTEKEANTFGAMKVKQMMAEDKDG